FGGARSAGGTLLRWDVAEVGSVLDGLGPGGADGIATLVEDRRALLLAVGLLHHLVERLLVGSERRPVLPAAGEDVHRPLAAVDDLVPGARPLLAIVGLLDTVGDLLHRLGEVVDA